MSILDDILEAKRKIEQNQKPIIHRAYVNPRDTIALISIGLIEGIDFFTSDSVPEGNIYVDDTICPLRIIDLMSLFKGEQKMLSLCFEPAQEKEPTPINREQRRKAAKEKKRKAAKGKKVKYGSNKS